VPALPELQREFAAGLRDGAHATAAWACDDGIAAAARLQLYRNNSRALFRQSLELTYPVVRRRVGDEFFRQLADAFRREHPSRAGDLHEVGRPWPGFLAAQLADSPYAWLAELAALEWACADAAVAADGEPVAAVALAAVPAEAVADERFVTVPSLRLVAATVPVLAVWRANRPEAAGGPVDLAAGPAYVRVHRRGDDVELCAMDAAEFAFLQALADGAPLAAALERAALPVDRLAPTLAALFADGCIAAVRGNAAGSGRTQDLPVDSLASTGSTP
jgi:hypothetical protein